MVNGIVNTEIIWDFQLRLSVKNDNISNILIKDCNRKNIIDQIPADIRVEQTEADILNGRDKQLEYAIEMLK